MLTWTFRMFCKGRVKLAKQNSKLTKLTLKLYLSLPLLVGCISLLVQLIHSEEEDCTPELRDRAAQALHNLIHCHQVSHHHHFHNVILSQAKVTLKWLFFYIKKINWNLFFKIEDYCYGNRWCKIVNLFHFAFSDRVLFFFQWKSQQVRKWFHGGIFY